MVFGTGQLTWEWQHHLRGSLHPWIFAALFKILSLCRMDYSWLIAYSPRLLQGALVARADMAIYRITNTIFGTSTDAPGSRAATWGIICSLTHWFTFYCGPRTLSSSSEAALVPRMCNAVASKCIDVPIVCNCLDIA
eukprot:m.27486 g.27486  ORF g.27486 m.27486 type:complete len:137 (+) comp8935_c0_seq3:566-976(+)